MRKVFRLNSWIDYVENSDIERRNNNLDLGAEKGTYHIKFSLGYFLPHAMTIFVGALGVGIFAGATGWKVFVAAPVTAFLLFPLAFLLWRTLPSLRDELKVFEKGFTYKTRHGLQTCLWGQIADHSDILDMGNRLKITSIEKKSGEKISFAYKMRGLDVLFYELSEFEYGNMPESDKATAEDIAEQPATLGSLVGTFRVKYGIGDLWPIFLLLFPAFLGVACIFALKDIAARILCPIPLVIPLVIFMWQMFAEWSDEMMVYENGFTYRSRKGLLSCLWDEIEDYSVAGRGPELSAIKKDDGTWIKIAMEMQGVEENLRPHLRKVIKWTGPEE